MTRSTSIEVYYQIKEEGLLSRERMRVYQWLFHNGPATAGEAAAGLGAVRNDVATRLTELRNRRVAQELGERACRVTGRPVICWDVTAHLPVEPPKVPRLTRKQLLERIKYLEGEVARLSGLRERPKNGEGPQLELF